jgi:symplekin
MGRMAIDQVVLGRIKPAEDTLVRRANPGWNRFAASTRGDRDSWLTILTRVASRSRGALEDIVVKKQDSDVLNPASVSDQIRDALYTYILEDFRKRIDVAISWLCEEWFSEKIKAKRSADSPHHYRKLVLRLLDGILPYLRLQDKVLTRFLGEIPELDGTILSRIKQMCRDPTVVPLALTSLLYLVMMKPPARELALDTVQEIWTECKAPAGIDTPLEC